MTRPVALLFGVHAHQPAGNFPAVVRDAHARCYRPFIDVLHRRPSFKFSMHVSGWLLEFLAREFPDDVDRLRRMVARGQLEIVGGGDMEPVLAAIPDADRRGQVQSLSRRLQRHFRVRPTGAWLAERVWEATIVPALADVGTRYALVDDYHFLCTGRAVEELGGYFRTEEDSRTLDVFPISEALRYRFPFAPAREAIAYVESLAGGDAAVYFDDIEKFGIWPETYEWVYGKSWLADFVDGIIASPHVEPMRYADFHAKNPSLGVVYLPSVSYFEMGEWALPPPAARRYAGLVQRAKHEGTFDADKPFLRGGSWRNFFSRYPEANWMHKRMEWVSRRFHALPETQRTSSMRADLHLAQANDAYWHGLFGGIYLPHLRRNVFAALARCERAIDARRRRPAIQRFDLDLDDRDECFLWCPAVLAAVHPSDGATLVELTHYGLAHNFCDTLARRDEPYFDTIRAKPEIGARAAAGVASIHDRVAFRSAIVEADLAVDAKPRASFRDLWIAADGAAVSPAYEPDGSMRRARFRARTGEIDVLKSFGVDRRGLTVEYELRSPSKAHGIFETELNLSLPSCDGPGGRFEDADSSRGLGEPWSASALSIVRIVDDVLKGSIEVQSEPPAGIEAAPLVTVSQSEEGFEKIMQAVTLKLRWPIEIDAGATRRVAVRLVIARERRREPHA